MTITARSTKAFGFSDKPLNALSQRELAQPFASGQSRATKKQALSAAGGLLTGNTAPRARAPMLAVAATLTAAGTGIKGILSVNRRDTAKNANPREFARPQTPAQKSGENRQSIRATNTKAMGFKDKALNAFTQAKFHAKKVAGFAADVGADVLMAATATAAIVNAAQGNQTAGNALAALSGIVFCARWAASEWRKDANPQIKPDTKPPAPSMAIPAV